MKVEWEGNQAALLTNMPHTLLQETHGPPHHPHLVNSLNSLTATHYNLSQPQYHNSQGFIHKSTYYKHCNLHIFISQNSLTDPLTITSHSHSTTIHKLSSTNPRISTAIYALSSTNLHIDYLHPASTSTDLTITSHSYSTTAYCHPRVQIPTQSITLHT